MDDKGKQFDDIVICKFCDAEYHFSEDHDCVPKLLKFREIDAARIADLEAQNAKLRESADWDVVNALAELVEARYQIEAYESELLRLADNGSEEDYELTWQLIAEWSPKEVDK